MPSITDEITTLALRTNGFVSPFSTYVKPTFYSSMPLGSSATTECLPCSMTEVDFKWVKEPPRVPSSVRDTITPSGEIPPPTLPSSSSTVVLPIGGTGGIGNGGGSGEGGEGGTGADVVVVPPAPAPLPDQIPPVPPGVLIPVLVQTVHISIYTYYGNVRLTITTTYGYEYIYIDMQNGQIAKGPFFVDPATFTVGDSSTMGSGSVLPGTPQVQVNPAVPGDVQYTGPGTLTAAPEMGGTDYTGGIRLDVEHPLKLRYYGGHLYIESSTIFNSEPVYVQLTGYDAVNDLLVTVDTNSIFVDINTRLRRQFEGVRSTIYNTPLSFMFTTAQATLGLAMTARAKYVSSVALSIVGLELVDKYPISSPILLGMAGSELSAKSTQTTHTSLSTL